MLSVTNDAAPTTRYARLRGMGAAKPQMKSAAVADVVFESEMVPVTEESGMAMSMDNADMGRTTDIELRTDLRKLPSFIRSFTRTFRVRSVSLSVCLKVSRPGISEDMLIHKI